MNNLYYYILLLLDNYPYDAVNNNQYKTNLLAYRKYIRYLVGKMVTHDTYTEMWAAANQLGDSIPSCWRLYHDGRRQLVRYGDIYIPDWWEGDRDVYRVVDRIP